MSISRIVTIYVLLVFAAAFLLVAPYAFLGPAAVERIAPVASDAFKTILGAAIGALSVALSIARSKER
jgi:multisubunit Na+/H+ antiporter MnhF subunit